MRGFLLAVVNETLAMADETSRNGSLAALMSMSDRRILDD